MIETDKILELSDLDSIKALDISQDEIQRLDISNSEILDIANDMFRIGSKSHLNSLNPETRQNLGLQLMHMSQAIPQAQNNYQLLKNKYVSLGKSYASISFLFDLIDEDFTILDILLMHELLMDDGCYRGSNIIIHRQDGTELVISHNDIDTKLRDLFSWYSSIKNNASLSKSVIAVMFHYYFLLIHPFNDGNGRVSRLFLNLILLKDGLFPIVISNENRKEYYRALTLADLGDLEPLINLVANIEKEKTSEYLKLTSDLSALEPDINCLVLTEDGNTEMINTLLGFHGFNLNKTAVESYYGKDNIASAAFLARKMKDKNTSLKQIIFHRDRDNENAQQLNQQISRSIKGNRIQDYSTVFITKFYDMESYFISAEHISTIFPEINITRSIELIDIATAETSEESKRKLRVAKSDSNKYAKIEDPEERSKQINDLYDSNPAEYRYGKIVLWRLEELITEELLIEGKITLVQQSEYVTISEFNKVRGLLDAME